MGDSIGDCGSLWFAVSNFMGHRGLLWVIPWVVVGRCGSLWVDVGDSMGRSGSLWGGLLNTSDAADEVLGVALCVRRLIEQDSRSSLCLLDM